MLIGKFLLDSNTIWTGDQQVIKIEGMYSNIKTVYFVLNFCWTGV